MIKNKKTVSQLAVVKRLITMYTEKICWYFEKYTPAGCSALDLSKIRVYPDNYESEKWQSYTLADIAPLTIPVLFSIPIDINDAVYASKLQHHINTHFNNHDSLVIVIDQPNKMLLGYSRALNNRLMMLKLTHIDGINEAEDLVSDVLFGCNEEYLGQYERSLLYLYEMLGKFSVHIMLKNVGKNPYPQSAEGYITEIKNGVIQLSPVQSSSPANSIVRLSDPWIIRDLGLNLIETDIVFNKAKLAKKVKQQIACSRQVVNFDNYSYHIEVDEIPY